MICIGLNAQANQDGRYDSGFLIKRTILNVPNKFCRIEPK